MLFVSKGYDQPQDIANERLWGVCTGCYGKCSEKLVREEALKEQFAALLRNRLEAGYVDELDRAPLPGLLSARARAMA